MPERRDIGNPPFYASSRPPGSVEPLDFYTANLALLYTSSRRHSRDSSNALFSAIS